MSELIFSESDIPFEQLERLGLTRKMIDDLPQHTQVAILRGERSPVLPLRIRLGKKTLKAYSRIRLVPVHPQGVDSNTVPSKENTDKKIALASVLFLPRLKYVQNDLFTQDQITDLYSGQTIKTALPDSSNLIIDNPVEYYCQLDQNTRQLLTTPAEHLEHNMKELIQRYQLNSAECRALINGTPITVYAQGDQMTFGIDLRDPNGIRVCNGNTKQWKFEFDNNLNNHLQGEKKYHFATNGCWIESSDGVLEYVDEDNYDQTIMEQLQLKRDLNLRDVSAQSSFNRGR